MRVAAIGRCESPRWGSGASSRRGARESPPRGAASRLVSPGRRQSEMRMGKGGKRTTKFGRDYKKSNSNTYKRAPHVTETKADALKDKKTQNQTPRSNAPYQQTTQIQRTKKRLLKDNKTIRHHIAILKKYPRVSSGGLAFTRRGKKSRNHSLLRSERCPTKINKLEPLI